MVPFVYNLKNKKYIKYNDIVAKYEDIFLDSSKKCCVCAKADEYYFMIYHFDNDYYIILDNCKSKISYYLKRMSDIRIKYLSGSDIEKEFKPNIHKIEDISKILFNNIDDIPDINDEIKLKLLLEN